MASASAIDIVFRLPDLAIPCALDDGAFMPVKGHEEDAGIDLRTPDEIYLRSGGYIAIDTKVRMDIPCGYFGKIEGKSGLNVKHGIVSLGGVIDAHYAGTIVVKLYNFGDEDYRFEAGDKIAQLIIQPCILPKLELTFVQDDSPRGDAGFGSTGK